MIARRPSSFAVLALCALALVAAPPAPPVHAATTRVDPRPVRVPVKVISTSNLTLSGPQTIDSVAVTAGDLVGALGQSDNRNAIYQVQSTAWRVVDPGIGTGLEVYAVAGSTNANAVYGCDTTGAITWGTTTTTFTKKSGAGASFNPSSAGAVTGSTFSGTVFDLAATPTPSATTNHTKLFRANGLGDHVGLLGSAGDLLIIEFDTGSGSSQIRKRNYVKTIVDDGTSDIQIAGGGHGRVTAVGASGSTSCAFSYAANAATTDNGLTGTNCATTDTDTKLCVFANSGNLRVKNRLGSSQAILIELDELVTP